MACFAHRVGFYPLKPRQCSRDSKSYHNVLDLAALTDDDKIAGTCGLLNLCRLGILTHLAIAVDTIRDAQRIRDTSV